MNVCITMPAGASVTGATTVTATADVVGTNPGVQRMRFTLDGAPMLTDFTSPYVFTLDSRRWGDGQHAMGVTALMRDGFVSGVVTKGLAFTNGQKKAPHNKLHFTPTSGSSPVPGAPLVVAAVGDGGGGEPGDAATVGLISSWNPNMFLYLGDVYQDGRAMEFDNWYGASGAPNLYGKFKSITNPTIGNHEYVGTDASGYFYYWDNVPHYYSFNAGGWHFISLDSTSQFGQTQPGSAQYTWLQQDLAANNPACTLVYFHHPLYNTGPEGTSPSLSAIWSLLAQERVSIVLNGHDHSYQRYAPLDGAGNTSPTGITQFIVGSGGHGHQAQAGTDSRMVASDFTNFGALQLKLYSTSAAFSFMATDGALVDTGIVPCRNTDDSAPPSSPTGLTATASSPGEVELAWGAASDDVGVAAYEIYRDGSTTPLTTLAPDARGYRDTLVAPASTHSYVVHAIDAAGNHSAPAGPTHVTTPDGTVVVTLRPVADAYVTSASPTTNFGTSSILRVGGGTTVLRSYLRFDLSNVVGRIQDASLRAFPNSSTSVGYAARGVSDSSWSELSITDLTAPAVDGATGGSSGAITAGSWTSADVTTLAAPAQGSLLTVALTGTGSQISLASRESTTPPQLVLTLGSGTSGRPSAGFTTSATTTIHDVPVVFTDTSSDNATSWSWDFGDGGTSTVPSPTHAWSTPGTYTVSLVVSNIYGPSEPATTTMTVTLDEEPPSIPSDLTATVAGPAEIDLAWSASSDNIGVTGYLVFRDSDTTPLATLDGSTLSYADTAVAPNSYHSYTVVAVDAAGNASEPAGPVDAATPDETITVVLVPIADAYVDSSSPGSNFGSGTALRVSGGSTVRRSYLRFDLAGIFGQIESASLQIAANSTSSLGYSAWGVADTTWSEMGITDTNAPGLDASATGASGPITAGTVSSVEIGPLARGSQGGLMSVGLTGTGTQQSLASRESATPPQLVLTIGGFSSLGRDAASVAVLREVPPSLSRLQQPQRV